MHTFFITGGKNEMTNLSVAETLIKVMKCGGSHSSANEKLVIRDHIQFVEDRCFNDVRYNIDSQRLRDDLGWKEEISWDVGIRKTVEWYLRKDSNGKFLERWPKHLVDQATVAHPRMVGKEASFGAL